MSVKYPYIANKRLYAAVMYACKLIRETGYRNKAIQTAANEYDFNFEDVEKEIIKRQVAGRKAKSKPRKYKWYIVGTYEACEADYEYNLISVKIKRALNKSNACRDWFDWNRSMDYGGSYAPFRHDEVIGEFECKKDAESALLKLGGD